MDNRCKFIKTLDKADCVGCGNCCAICPTVALKLGFDDKGFLYPDFNKEKCINCGKCSKICPIEKTNHFEIEKNGFACQNKDEKDLALSSSGGMFIAFSKNILEKGGEIYGCMYDENMQPIIKGINCNKDLVFLQGSKYVEAYINGTFEEIKNKLDNGITVLVCLTPCLIAALKCFLGKVYNNLFTIDFICHGVPSRKIFEAQIMYLEKKHNCKITNYLFRDKNFAGWGINSLINYKKNNKIYKIKKIGNLNPYIMAFNKGILNRDACYTCNFSGGNNFSDITIGDFWGVNNFYKNFDSDKGVSLLILNSLKGEKLFCEVKQQFLYSETALEDIAKENKSLLLKRNENIPQENNNLYSMLNKADFKKIEKKYMKKRYSFKNIIKQTIPVNILRRIKK